MLVEERQTALYTELMRKKALTVEEGAVLCDVSPDTIRRDFRAMAERGLAQRTHGGVVLAEAYASDTHLRDREILHRAEKRRIAEYAAGLIRPGETVAIDAGTTAVEAVPFLSKIANLTVLTYSLDVARAVVDTRRIGCIMLGGVVRENTYSAVGPDALAMLHRFQVTTLFLGANAISLERGLMTPNRMEAEVKQGLIEIAQRVVLLADSSKLGRRALVSFADFSRLDTFVTDDGADAEKIELLREVGVEVVTLTGGPTGTVPAGPEAG